MEQRIIDQISIMIASYRTPDLLKRCLDSLRAACGGVFPETIVVDDAAGDLETARMMEPYQRCGVQFKVMPQNGGFAGANNFGYPFCTKPYIVLVNSDIVLHGEPFTAMVTFMETHPKAEIIQGTVVIRNGQEGVDGTLNGTGSYLTPCGVMLSPGWLKPVDHPLARRAAPVFAAYGAFFMLRNGLDRRVGGYLFHSVFHTYYEEVDLCHRTWLSGGEVWYVPTPVIDHAHGSTVSRYLDREETLRKYYRNIRFSFSTCFGLRGRLLVRPLFELLCLGQILWKLMRGDGSAWREHLWAYRALHDLRGEIREVRGAVQAMRTVSDTALFKRVMRRHTLRQFLETVKVNG